MIRTQLHAVSTTTGAGKSFAQLPINIAIRHMANSLLYITGTFRCISPAFCRGDSSSGVLFGSLLFGFGFRFISASRMT
ncbi:hypothetical protein HV105_17105 [Klebsiella michiganensis]|nr:hypothetical protein HV105_17105 [Klebsiella michiganensis]